MPAILLKHIEKIANKPIHELFDLICGTSVGAVIAGVCATPHKIIPTVTRTNLDQAITELKQTKMFETSFLRNLTSGFGLLKARVPTIVRDSTMNKLYGDTRMSQGLTDILTVSYDLSTNGARIFSSAKARNNPEQEDVLITDAVRASASVPTIWEPLQVGSSICIDGGLFSNNPLLYGLSDAINVYNRDPDNCIVFSLGTGYMIDQNPDNLRISTTGIKFLEKVIRAVVSTDTINSIALTRTFVPNINQFVHIDFPLHWSQFKLLSTQKSFINDLDNIANQVINENNNILNKLVAYLTGNIPLKAPKYENGKQIGYFYSNVAKLSK
jgi:hypothetical protein